MLRTSRWRLARSIDHRRCSPAEGRGRIGSGWAREVKEGIGVWAVERMRRECSIDLQAGAVAGADGGIGWRERARAHASASPVAGLARAGGWPHRTGSIMSSIRIGHSSSSGGDNTAAERASGTAERASAEAAAATSDAGGRGAAAVEAAGAAVECGGRVPKEEEVPAEAMVAVGRDASPSSCRLRDT
jgi:hypothetical protein